MPRAPARPPALLPALVVALAIALVATAPPAAPVEEGAACDPLDAREIAAQLVMSGVPGTAAGERAREVVARHAGSVVLMPPNVEGAGQVSELVAGLRSAAPAGLLVAVDEEGGRVARLGAVDAVERLPSARALADGGDPAEVERLATELGTDLAGLGIDLNLAPVLDVTGAAGGTVIGDRAYAADAERVARYGAAFAEGLRAGGVGAVGKHFPGHGRTTVDSHRTLPTVEASLEELRSTDLLAFRRALDHLDAVMTAHVVVTALDDELPASLSPAAHALLREDWGFDGLIVSDALEMGAIGQTWSLPAAAEQAIAAGADLALLAGPWWEAEAVTDRLVEAIDEGRLGRAAVHASVRRVLAAKGHGPEEATCLLGLPPIARAGTVVVDGATASVAAGRWRALPADWALEDPAGYDPAELATLERGAPVACLAGGCGRAVRGAGLAWTAASP
ncbi:MAG: beta-N-acetylhexosaminidase [Actinomycetota bacterium]